MSALSQERVSASPGLRGLGDLGNQTGKASEVFAALSSSGPLMVKTYEQELADRDKAVTAAPTLPLGLFPPFLFLSPKSAFSPASIKGLPVCSALLVMSLEIKELADLWSNVTMEIGDVNHCLLGKAG